MSDTDTEATVPAPVPKTTVSITVDGKPHEANPGQLVIDACEDAGVFVPRFCHHPRMTPVGMCRQCLVEVQGPRGPMMVVSCMTVVSADQAVLTDTPTVKKAQEGVLEFLLANHPLDCPVCDKGGECPLQDQAFSHGPGESRYVEAKRNYEKPIPISDLVFLDRERCILCDRCTRFAKEVAGDPLIHFTSRGNDTQVQTFPGDPFSSYFSGNTVQICPVGALTAKPYRFKARPWDLDQTRSTCTTCAVGCQTVVQSSRDELLRYQGHDDDDVNWGWLCDKGRFGFESPNSDQRLTDPLVVAHGSLSTTTWNAALDAATKLIKKAIADGGPTKLAVIGGARLANEDATAWARLAKRVIGTPHVDAQLGDGLPVELLGLPRASITEACSASTLVLLGPDLKEELPVLYLRIRDAAEKRTIRLIEISPTQTGLSKYAYTSIRSAPGEQAGAVRQLLIDEAEQLAKGQVVVVAGRSNLAESPTFTMDALATLQAGVTGLKVLPALRRGNIVGAIQAGLTPGDGGRDTAGILRDAAAGHIGCLVLLGADPLSDFPDYELARQGLAGAGSIIAIDTFLTSSSAMATVVLPAAGYGERAGSTTNIEGRILPLTQKVNPKGVSRPDWMIARDLSDRLGGDLGIESLDDAHDLYMALVDALVPSSMPLSNSSSLPPTRGGYDLRLVVGHNLYDEGVALRTSPSLSELSRGAHARLHPIDAGRLGAINGTRVRITARSGRTLTIPVFADDAVPQGLVAVAANQRDQISDLIDIQAVTNDVKVDLA